MAVKYVSPKNRLDSVVLESAVEGISDLDRYYVQRMAAEIVDNVANRSRGKNSLGAATALEIVAHIGMLAAGLDPKTLLNDNERLAMVDLT